MGSAELVKIWEHLKTVEEFIFKVAMQYEGVERALDATMPEFKNRRIEQQAIADQLYSRSHEDRLGAIDAAIRRLESPGSLSR